MAKDKVYVANESFTTTIDGVQTSVRRGQRVVGGHALLDGRAHLFDEAEVGALRSVQAESAAARSRQSPPAQGVDLSALSREKLDEIAASKGVADPSSLANKDAVIEAIEGAG